MTWRGRPTRPLASRWLAVEGQPVHYLDSAAGAPGADGTTGAAGKPDVVLVHGMVVASRYMVPAGSLLAPHHRVLAPDLPGYGRSPDPGRVLRLPELADALAGWMRAVGLGRATLLGNSFGCQIIVELATRHPDLVSHVVLQGPTRDPHHPRAWQQLRRWNHNRKLEPESLGPIVRGDYLRAGVTRACVTFREMLRDRIEEKLPRVRVPALVVGGTRDLITPPEWVEEAARLLPDGRAVVIPGGTHTANYSHAPQVVDRVLPFLRGTG